MARDLHPRGGQPLVGLGTRVSQRTKGERGVKSMPGQFNGRRHFAVGSGFARRREIHHSTAAVLYLHYTWRLRDTTFNVTQNHPRRLLDLLCMQCSSGHTEPLLEHTVLLSASATHPGK